MDKKKLRTSAVCLLVTAIIYVAGSMYTSEMTALGWHAIHGRTVHLTSPLGPKFDVDVPMLVLPILDEGRWNLSMNFRWRRLPFGSGSNKWGSMTFSVSPPPTAEAIRESTPRLRSHGIILTEIAKISSSGQDFFCFEHAFQNSNPPVSPREDLFIECYPLSDKRGMHAMFIGSQALLPDFYNILSRVTRAN